MAVSFDVNAQARDDEGKGASRRLRRHGQIPGVIYGGGKEPQSIQMAGNEVAKHLEHEAFYSHILNVSVNGKPQKAILRDVQRHPAKDTVMHMDFLRVADKDMIKMNVPLHFTNEDVCVGVKAGGSVSRNLTDIEVSCKAKDLPEFIEVDLADVDMGQSLHLSDLSMPKGVESVALSHGSEHDQAVVTIHGKGAGAGVDEAQEADDSAESADQ